MRPKKNSGGAKIISGAELRARREQRAAAVDPKAEAQRRETSLLKSLSTAREDFDWFVANRAWEPLGYDTFTGWWAARVQPVADGLMKPVRDVARTAIDIMTEEQKALPPAQRIPQRKIAAMVGANQSTVSRRSHDADASGADLENSPVPQLHPSAPTLGGEPGTQTTADPDNALVASAVDPEQIGEGEEPETLPGSSPQSTPTAEHGDDTTEWPHGNAERQQSGVDHLGTAAPGEAPTGSESPSSAGAQPGSDGEPLPDETPEGLLAPQPGPSGVDPQGQELIEEGVLIASPEELKALYDEWLDVLDRRIDYASLAPLFTNAALTDLMLQAEGFVSVPKLLQRWRNEA